MRLLLSSSTISQHSNEHGGTKVDKISQLPMTIDKYLKSQQSHSSPLSSGVIFSIRLFDSSTSSSSQMNAVGGRSSPFPKTNLCISNSKQPELLFHSAGKNSPFLLSPQYREPVCNQTNASTSFWTRVVHPA